MSGKRVGQFVTRPGIAIPLTVMLSFAAFLVTIPLPRADGHLIGSDGIGYYVYLPSVWLDRDLDFSNEYTVFFAYVAENPSANPFYLQRTDQGVPPNQWSIGPALLWSPFFLLAHLLSLGLSSMGIPVQADGYGYLYQAFVLSGSILYAGLGVWFTFCFVRRWIQPRAALTGVMLVVLSGNLIYYMTAEPSMSHALSAFASGLFFLTWVTRRDQDDLLTPVILGAEAGLMALIRPQDGLLLILPLLDRVPHTIRGFNVDGRVALFRWFRSALLAGLAALAVFSLQMSTWWIIYGSFFVSGYTYGGGGFNWLNPRLMEVIFSPERGLFVWHPIFLAALVGLGSIWRIDRRMSVLGFAGVAIQWYIIASWGDWMQGDAFGGRMFIVCTPIFALGLAMFVARVAKYWSWRIVAVAGMFLLAWNFLLFVEYRFDLVMAQRTANWHDLTVGRLTKPIDMILHRLR